MSPRHLLVTLGLSAALLAGCSSPDASDPAQPADSSAAEPSTAGRSVDASDDASDDSPTSTSADVDGLVNVDGRDLFVHCTGSGRPTVVILHGWIDQPGLTSYGFYGPLIEELAPGFRVCSYDRVNVGQSETVPGTQTPARVVADLDGLMAALGEEGPFVLIGQSAGGMVASAYAVAHPDKVAGIVMVDAAFDEEVLLEDVVPEGVGACDPVNRRVDGRQSLQKIDNCSMYRWAYHRRDQRPEVPLVYLAAKQAPWSGFTEFGSRYTKRIVALQKSYAASWSPGRFHWVDSGHEIHYERPGVVGAAVRWVVEKGRR